MSRRRVAGIVADQLDADLQAFETGVVEGEAVKSCIATADEHIGRAVIGTARRHDVHVAADTGPEIALLLIQSVTDIAPALRPPDILQFRVEIGGNELGELIFEALTRSIREGKVVGVGAGGKRALRHQAARAEQDQSDDCDAPHRGAATAPHGLPPSFTVAITLPAFRSMMVSVPARPLAA